MTLIQKLSAGIYSLIGLGMPETIDLSDAPGGDISLDDIFGEHPNPSTTVVAAPEPQTPTVTTPAEPVIKTKTGTVYKSIEDAVSGIEHKDALIAQLRDEVKRNTGKDPLTPNPKPTPSTSYVDNQEQYFEDIADAVNKKDQRAYMLAQQKLIWDSLGPLAPTITALSKANAERIVVSEIPDFKGFLGSDQYSQLANDAPLLADAIRTAEENPRAAQQLPELYKIAYLANQGRRVPELIQSAEATRSATPPRPTVHSVQVPPPSSTGTPTVQPSLETKEGRRALIEKMEGAGIGSQRW